MLTFANNAAGQFSTALLALAPGESRVDTAQMPIAEADTFTGVAPDKGIYMHVTITSAEMPGVYEIAELRIVTRNPPIATFTLHRKREEDDPNTYAWPAGSTVEARVTAAMLSSFPQLRDDILDAQTLLPGREYLMFGVDPVVVQSSPLNEYAQYEARNYPSATDVIYRTPLVDIGEPAVYDENTSYRRDSIIVENSAATRQYLMLGNRRSASPTGAITFPANAWESIPALDGNLVEVGKWAPRAMPIEMDEQFPSGFVLTEVGFLTTGSSGTFTTPPNVKIGPSHDPGRHYHDGPLEGSIRILVPPEYAFEDGGLAIKVTHGTDASLTGNFYYRGFRAATSND